MKHSKQFPKRYIKNFKTLSLEDQEKLEKSSVGIVGCGGLGGYLAEELTRLGIGHLVLIDGDYFDETNLNRQLMATENTIGKRKVDAAFERLLTVNSGMAIRRIPEWMNEDNGVEMLRGVDLVLDGLDSSADRITLEKVCGILGVPLVYSSIAGWYGILGVSFPGDNSVVSLYGNAEKGIEQTLGNPSFAPAVVASMAVAEAVKILTNKPSSLRNAWLHIDLLEMEFERFNF